MFLTSKNSIIQYEQWELSKQPFSSQYPIYVMNMRQRKDKWDGIKKRFEHEKLTWSEGFNVREDYSIVDKFVKDGLLKPPQGVINYGNLGCASAHIHVWKKVGFGR
jgi:GR25 family glycosyltransferase involved in LPS biosynthesis